jgi:threonine dehydrogenase-like Zn-dependent dehydrogenase
MATPLPPHHRALQLSQIGADLNLVTLPTPQPVPGSAIVHISASSILSYHRDIYNGTRHYTFPTPIVCGSSAIGLITALGPDATSLQPTQLVYIDCVIRARDDPDTLFLSAIHDSGQPRSQALMRDVWRDGTFAEYVCFPLENCFPLDKTLLSAYSVEELMYMAHLLVPFGGLRDIGLCAGETVVISPATGGYGGAGVLVALAMGARVVAAGRSKGKLEALRGRVEACVPGARVEILAWTGDEEGDTAALKAFGTIDAVLDLTPPQGAESLHLRSATSALRRGGRVSVMGFVDKVAVPWTLVGRNITVKGKLMYEREDVLLLIKMLERGLFPVGKALVETKVFGLDEWQAGMDEAAEWSGLGKQVVFVP